MVVLGGLGSITGSTITAVFLRVLEEQLREVSWAYGLGMALTVLAAILSLPRYRPDMRKSPIAALRWLLWPALSGAAIALERLTQPKDWRTPLACVEDPHHQEAR